MLDTLFSTPLGDNMAGSGIMIAGVILGVKMTVDIIQKVSGLLTQKDKAEILTEKDLKEFLHSACTAQKSAPCEDHSDLIQKTTEMLILQKTSIKAVEEFSNRTEKYFDETFGRVRLVEERVGNVEGDIKSLNARVRT
jgi:hypothetical protein